MNDFEAQFLYAAKNGYIERATRLLDGSFDPSKNDNEIIKWASENGHVEVVRVLLRDKRVDPRAEDCICITLASSNGHLEVLKLLLDAGVEPQEWTLWLACQNGHLEVVQELLKDPRVDRNIVIDELSCLEVAVLHEHYQIGELLLGSDSMNTVRERLPRRSTEVKSIRRGLTMEFDRVGDGLNVIAKGTGTGAGAVAGAIVDTPIPLVTPIVTTPIQTPSNTQETQEIPQDTQTQQKWNELILLRKSIPLSEFKSKLLHLPLPSQQTLNEILILLAQPYSGEKVQGRGTMFEFTRVVLERCQGCGLKVDHGTIKVFQKHRYICKKNPLLLLQDFT